MIRQRIFSEAEAAHRDDRRHGTKSASALLKILCLRTIAGFRRASALGCSAPSEADQPALACFIVRILESPQIDQSSRALALRFALLLDISGRLKYTDHTNPGVAEDR